MNKSNIASVEDAPAKSGVNNSGKSVERVKITCDGILTVSAQRKELVKITEGALRCVGGRNNNALKHEDLTDPWAIINSMYIDGKFDANSLRKCTGDLNAYLFISIKNYLLDHCIWKRNVRKQEFLDGQKCFADCPDQSPEKLIPDLIRASYEYNNIDTDSIIKSNMKIVQNMVIKIGLNKNKLFMTILDGLRQGKTKQEIMPQFKAQWTKTGKKNLKDDIAWNRNFDLVKHRGFKALAQEKETYKKYRTY